MSGIKSNPSPICIFVAVIVTILIWDCVTFSLFHAMHDEVCPKCEKPPACKTDNCLITNPKTVKISPCYTISDGTLVVHDDDIINRDLLDMANVSRNPTLVIDAPTSIIFDNSYELVIFSGSALQYYFPKLTGYTYAISYQPERFIKNRQQNMTSECVGHKYCATINNIYTCIDTEWMKIACVV